MTPTAGLVFLALAATPAAAPDAGAGVPLPRLEGWRLTDSPTRYGPETLFEYINGGADAFLQQDFEELITGTYANAQNIEVTVDLYRHRDAFRAFAIYSQERPAGVAPLPVGIEGYSGPDYLQFVVGSTYVKMTQAGGAPVLREIAEKVAAGLPGTREPPEILARFPEKGRLPRAEKLSAKEFLGHAFLHDGCAAPYEVGGQRFRLFVVQGRDEADARAMVQRYHALAKLADAVAPEGAATLKDPLNGEVLLRWKGRWIWGAVDGPSAQRTRLLKELGRGFAEAGAAATTSDLSGAPKAAVAVPAALQQALEAQFGRRLAQVTSITATELGRSLPGFRFFAVDVRNPTAAIKGPELFRETTAVAEDGEILVFGRDRGLFEFLERNVRLASVGSGAEDLVKSVCLLGRVTLVEGAAALDRLCTRASREARDPREREIRPVSATEREDGSGSIVFYAVADGSICTTVRYTLLVTSDRRVRVSADALSRRLGYR